MLVECLTQWQEVSHTLLTELASGTPTFPKG